ncbi:hypothetical protein BC829DRAFT_439039 [Chytridium lagenaria]|nr:hypothetical protein BC829DRAFT_439039 [Chytridium lagenaria]
MLQTRRIALLDKENTPLKTSKVSSKTPGTVLGKNLAGRTPLGNGKQALGTKPVASAALKPKGLRDITNATPVALKKTDGKFTGVTTGKKPLMAKSKPSLLNEAIQRNAEAKETSKSALMQKSKHQDMMETMMPLAEEEEFPEVEYMAPAEKDVDFTRRSFGITVPTWNPIPSSPKPIMLEDEGPSENVYVSKHLRQMIEVLQITVVRINGEQMVLSSRLNASATANSMLEGSDTNSKYDSLAVSSKAQIDGIEAGARDIQQKLVEAKNRNETLTVQLQKANNEKTEIEMALSDAHKRFEMLERKKVSLKTRAGEMVEGLRVEVEKLQEVNEEMVESKKELDGIVARFDEEKQRLKRNRMGSWLELKKKKKQQETERREAEILRDSLKKDASLMLQERDAAITNLQQAITSISRSTGIAIENKDQENKGLWCEINRVWQILKMERVIKKKGQRGRARLSRIGILEAENSKLSTALKLKSAERDAQIIVNSTLVQEISDIKDHLKDEQIKATDAKKDKGPTLQESFEISMSNWTIKWTHLKSKRRTLNYQLSAKDHLIAKLKSALVAKDDLIANFKSELVVSEERAKNLLSPFRGVAPSADAGISHSSQKHSTGSSRKRGSKEADGLVVDALRKIQRTDVNGSSDLSPRGDVGNVTRKKRFFREF